MTKTVDPTKCLNYLGLKKKALLKELAYYAQSVANLQSGTAKSDSEQSSRLKKTSTCNFLPRNIMNVNSASNTYILIGFFNDRTLMSPKLLTILE